MEKINLSERRIEYIDAMRGGSILLVVLSHILNIGIGNYDDHDAGNTVY